MSAVVVSDVAASAVAANAVVVSAGTMYADAACVVDVCCCLRP